VAEASVTRTAEELVPAAKLAKSCVAGKGDPLHGTPLFTTLANKVGAAVATIRLVTGNVAPTPRILAVTLAARVPAANGATAARIPEMLIVTGVAGAAGTVYERGLNDIVVAEVILRFAVVAPVCVIPMGFPFPSNLLVMFAFSEMKSVRAAVEFATPPLQEIMMSPTRSASPSTRTPAAVEFATQLGCCANAVPAKPNAAAQTKPSHFPVIILLLV
jgi:hypothetical protein